MRWDSRDVIPQHVFVLDVEPGAALARQNRPDRIGKEGVDFQREVREAYLALGEQDPEKVTILDGALSVDELVDSIVDVVR